MLCSCVLLSINAQANEKRLSIAYGLENYDFTELFEQFTKETGIKISATPFKNNVLKAELLQRSNVDELPDVVIVPSDFIGLEEINFSEVPSSLLSESLTEKSKSSVKIRSKYFGIPLISGNYLVLYYNKNLIKKVATSWQQLIQQKAELSEGIRLIAWSYHEMYWFIPFLGVFQEFPYINGELNFRTKGMKKALAWYKSLSDNGWVNSDCDYKCSADQFTNNKVAYTINGTWALNQFNDQLGDNLGVAMLPSYQTQLMTPYFSSHVLAFPSPGLNGSASEELKILANFFQRQDIQQLMWEKMKSIPTHKAVMANIINGNDDQMKTILSQLEQSEPMPNESNMAIVWEAMLKGVNRYHAGLFDEEQATQYMHYIANKSITHAQQK